MEIIYIMEIINIMEIIKIMEIIYSEDSVSVIKEIVVLIYI